MPTSTARHDRYDLRRAPAQVQRVTPEREPRRTLHASRCRPSDGKSDAAHRRDGDPCQEGDSHGVRSLPQVGRNADDQLRNTSLLACGKMATCSTPQSTKTPNATSSAAAGGYGQATLGQRVEIHSDPLRGSSLSTDPARIHRAGHRRRRTLSALAGPDKISQRRCRTIQLSLLFRRL